MINLENYDHKSISTEPKDYEPSEYVVSRNNQLS
jgi:hypothetical protein